MPSYDSLRAACGGCSFARACGRSRNDIIFGRLSQYFNAAKTKMYYLVWHKKNNPICLQNPVDFLLLYGIMNKMRCYSNFYEGEQLWDC